ncbi:hypothetical protein [Mycobacterium sp. IDR2000157661]|uniref:hypothetical protein n=1 Tax=Mycobacterium sp. IDR2000157661 TaxID=2867005 RepID=UPI001EEA4D81|nr:hypothetical protein [Mycobacterium sp. IDR2000157661]ULE33616.1 hypothetical protein K3G64_02590 [Mycobacterium sp. IDR2000157661]
MKTVAAVAWVSALLICFLWVTALLVMNRVWLGVAIMGLMSLSLGGGVAVWWLA